METVTVRVSNRVRETLQELARDSDRSMQSVLSDAVEEYRRRRVLEKTNEAYAALRADPTAWAEELEERRALESTLGDGLEDDR